MIFNIPFNKKNVLFKSINEKFSSVLNKIENQRNIEIDSMLKQIEWILDNNNSREIRYKSARFLDGIIESGIDSYNIEYLKILEEETGLKKILNYFRFEDVDIHLLNEAEKKNQKLNEEMDFTNLVCCDQDEELAINNNQTKEEKEYFQVHTL